MSSGMRRRKAGSSGGATTLRPTQQASIVQQLKGVDMFPKLKKVERTQTRSGAAMSLLSMAVVAILTLSEIARYLTIEIHDHMVVDPSFGQKLKIDFNVSFHALNCKKINLDAMDVSGDQQQTHEHVITKTRLRKNTLHPAAPAFPHLLPWEVQDALEAEELKVVKEGDCKSCYGAESASRKCCNTCEELKAAYVDKGWNAAAVSKIASQCKDVPSSRDPAEQSQEGEGCNLQGYLLVNKVAGNLNAALGEIHVQDSRHIHQFNPQDIPKFNVSHTVHYLRFGQDLPGMHAPLEEVVQLPEEGAGVYQYYIKLVPTLYQPLGGEPLQSNQFSVATQFRPAVVQGVRQAVLPGVFFVYDFSPFMVRREERREPLAQLLVGLCAVAGGVFTVARLLDSWVFGLSNWVKGKGGAAGALGAFGAAVGQAGRRLKPGSRGKGAGAFALGAAAAAAQGLSGMVGKISTGLQQARPSGPGPRQSQPAAAAGGRPPAGSFGHGSGLGQGAGQSSAVGSPLAGVGVSTTGSAAAGSPTPQHAGTPGTHPQGASNGNGQQSWGGQTSMNGVGAGRPGGSTSTSTSTAGSGAGPGSPVAQPGLTAIGRRPAAKAD